MAAYSTQINGNNFWTRYSCVYFEWGCSLYDENYWRSGLLWNHTWRCIPIRLVSLIWPSNLGAKKWHRKTQRSLKPRKLTKTEQVPRKSSESDSEYNPRWIDSFFWMFKKLEIKEKGFKKIVLIIIQKEEIQLLIWRPKLKNWDSNTKLLGIMTSIIMGKKTMSTIMLMITKQKQNTIWLLRSKRKLRENLATLFYRSFRTSTSIPLVKLKNNRCWMQGKPKSWHSLRRKTRKKVMMLITLRRIRWLSKCNSDK